MNDEVNVPASESEPVIVLEEAAAPEVPGTYVGALAVKLAELKRAGVVGRQRWEELLARLRREELERQWTEARTRVVGEVERGLTLAQGRGAELLLRGLRALKQRVEAAEVSLVRSKPAEPSPAQA